MEDKGGFWMLRGILKKSTRLYRANLGSLLLYFGIYGAVLSGMGYLINLLNIYQAELVLPLFFLSPVLLLLMKRCFELVMDKELDTGVELGKTYRLAFFTVALPVGVKELMPVIPHYSNRVDLIVFLLMLYVLGRFFLTSYIFLLNPRLPVGQIIRLSWGKMKGNLASLGMMMVILCLPLLIPMGINLFLEGIGTMVLKIIVIAVYVPFLMLSVTVFAARILGGEDANIKVKLNELDLKHFFEETVENGPGIAETQKINRELIEEIENIPAPPEKKKRPKQMPLQEEWAEDEQDWQDEEEWEEDEWEEEPQQPTQSFRSPAVQPSPRQPAHDDYEWGEEDQLDLRYFKGMEPEEEVQTRAPRAVQPSAQPRAAVGGGISTMQQLKTVKDYSHKKVFHLRQGEIPDAHTQFAQVVPYSFLAENTQLLHSFEEVLRGTLKRFDKSPQDNRYGAHYKNIELEGNAFSWLMELKQEGDTLVESVELYINNANW